MREKNLVTVPSSYTEATLAQFMIDSLSDVAPVIGKTSTNEFSEQVNDALILYGVDDIADATDIPKIRACAKVAVWRKALVDLMTRYSFQTDQQRFDRIEMAKLAKVVLANAEQEATAEGVVSIGPVIEVGTLNYPDDPYGPARDLDYDLA